MRSSCIASIAQSDRPAEVSATSASTGRGFPYPDGRFDVVYAASVFTHMVPESTRNYFSESARVLKPGGRCLFSFFLLDHYRPGQRRPLGFVTIAEDFAIADQANPERMTAYRLCLIEDFAARAGLRLAQPPLPGLWSDSTETWIGTQDVVVLCKQRHDPSVSA